MILVIDDDITVLGSLDFLLKRAGYEPHTVATPKEAIEVVRNQTPRLVMLDMNFTQTTSGEEGLTLLKQIKLFAPSVPVILMTAWGSISLAVEGMRCGAFDFITKPWNNIQLLSVIETALSLTEKREEITDTTDSEFSKIIGQSRAIKDILETVKRIAKTNASVLITGESGTGKELIAEAIHTLSSRSDKPFVKVNLGGMVTSLFESEMFGHKKGAFTDAYADRDGRFSLANRGTIFLDEIGDLDMTCQVKLLRVLQEGTFEVLGESRPRRVDLRVVSATNKNLKEMVQQGTFREDLLYRVNLIPIHLPPLRERIDDIAPLVYHFAGRTALEYSLGEIKFTPEAIQYLERLPYPGNIRELKNLIVRTILISGAGGDKPLDKSDFEQLQSNTPDSSNSDEMTLKNIEQQRIEEALKATNYNISRTADLLGISRGSLYRRIEKHDIKL